MATSETALIAEQLSRSYQGPAWHGPALTEVLADITSERAQAHPVEGGHSIWEIALHITAWLQIARERLSATSPVDPTPAQDWPAVSGDWPATLAELQRQQQLLERAVLAFPENRLPETAPATEPQTFYILLHGIAQHTCYHTGQIALLKKLT